MPFHDDVLDCTVDDSPASRRATAGPTARTTPARGLDGLLRIVSFTHS